MAPDPHAEESSSVFRCPICDTVVPATAPSCPTCGADFLATSQPGEQPQARPPRRLRGEYSEADVRELARIPGVGAANAERLCKAGYTAPWKILAATVEDLAKVPGVGPGGARTIKESSRIVFILHKRRTKEQVLAEEYACPLCGSVTSLFARRCHDCGAEFDDEEMDDMLRAELRGGGDKSELAFYEVRLMEDQGDPDLWYARGLLLRDMGQLPDAIASFDRALELAPNAPRVLLARASLMAQVREVAAASRHLQDSIAGLVQEAETKLAVLEERKVEVEAIAALAGLEETRCPVCGEPVVRGAAFCPACNASLIPWPEVPPEPEADDADATPPDDETPPPPPEIEPGPEVMREDQVVALPPPPPEPATTETFVATPPATEEDRDAWVEAPSGRVGAWASASWAVILRGLRTALPLLAPAAVVTGAGVYGIAAVAGLGQGPPAMAALMIGGAVAVAFGIALRRPT